MAKLYLVGSGPGDPDLITRKALKVIQNADAILYDNLVNKELLEEAKKSCIKIYAGKKAQHESIEQANINKQILDLSKSVENIVRLKGGDPMIFGRAHEEITWARENHISVEVIPGISSLNAFAAIYQAPITKRKECYGFWVISATTHVRELSKEVKIAAHSSSNILIFMGLHKLKYIVEEFLNHKPHTYPIGVFQEISMPNSAFVIGTLGDIEKKVEERRIEAPALVVVGNVLLDII